MKLFPFFYFPIPFSRSSSSFKLECFQVAKICREVLHYTLWIRRFTKFQCLPMAFKIRKIIFWPFSFARTKWNLAQSWGTQLCSWWRKKIVNRIFWIFFIFSFSWIYRVTKVPSWTRGSKNNIIATIFLSKFLAQDNDFTAFWLVP